MSTIPQDERKSKSVDEVKRWTEKKKQSRAMSKRLYSLGVDFHSRAIRMEQCGDILLQAVCPVCGQYHDTTAKLCRDRLCPTCQWRLSRARYSQMMQCIEIMKPKLLDTQGFCQMITLTIKNVPLHELRHAIESLSTGWHNLARRKPYNQSFAWARNLEITINPRTREAHPHLHILMFWKGKDREAVTAANKSLAKDWREVMRLGYLPQTDVRNAYCKSTLADIKPGDSEAIVEAAKEAAKYTVKDSQLAKLTNTELEIFARSIAGIRFCSYGGELKKIRSKLGLSDEDYNGEDRTHCTCGAKLIQCVLEWNGSTYAVKALQTIGGAEK